ncbi:glycosyltransferase family 4 protein [Shewanella dokdonensis]|uniref:Glycosyltransferase family 4 protein n=1 Tax=Shewanella dokdonensis TaxID=712036 RepID=A0ABX8DFZ9_9GAMM|nr:glycosyltransferase [Shewanella dokdonensis]QVK23669.1 glycosyltransferase family 4 protein [Shewanella dokdonensis]
MVLYITNSRSLLGFYREIPYFLIAKIFNVPLVTHLHGADFNIFFESLGYLNRKLVRFCYNIPKVNIVLNERMRKEYSCLGINVSTTVIPNFVDLSFVDSVNKNDLNKKFDINNIKVIFLSNLLEDKGIFELLYGYLQCSDDVKSRISINIVGKPMFKNKSSLKNFFDLLDATNGKVIYKGPKYNQDKWSELLSSDILILPTYYATEAFPLVFLEAAASGCFILTTKHNYLESVLSDFYCNFFEPKSSSEVSRVFTEMTRNLNTLTLGKENNFLISKRYSKSFYESNLLDVFQSVLE